MVWRGISLSGDYEKNILGFYGLVIISPAYLRKLYKTPILYCQYGFMLGLKCFYPKYKPKLYCQQLQYLSYPKCIDIFTIPFPGRHRSLVIERSPLVHEVHGSKSDYEIWVTFHFGTDKLSLFTQQWMGTWRSLELGKVKGGEERNWPPYLIMPWLCVVLLYKARLLRYYIVWEYLYFTKLN